MGEEAKFKYRAIVIDDMDFCRELLTDFLQDRGYQVISFPDPTTCPLFPARQSECPKQFACADFLLTDNRMPHLAGVDFLELQAQGKCKIEVSRKAILSAYWTVEDLSRVEQLGCRSVSKPYDLKRLGSWLDSQEALISENRQLTELCESMRTRKIK